MIYPQNFEDKIEFSTVREFLSGYCVSVLGRDKLAEVKFTFDKDLIELMIRQTMEFIEILKFDNFPILNIYDLRFNIKRIRINESYLSVQELYELYKSLITLGQILVFLNQTDESVNHNYKYPNLQMLTDGCFDVSKIYKCISSVLTDNGAIKDTASPDLARIRREKATAERNVSKILHNILKNAQKEGFVESDVSPSIRDGRLVIPVAPAYKRRINGIVHDESDTGKTVFIEPTQVVEANNQITELENQERKEITRILKNVASAIRPHIDDILNSFKILGEIDFIRAKAKFAIQTDSRMPVIKESPLLHWSYAIHPLLKIYFDRKETENQSVVPLDISLQAPLQRILIISGPNAGGKSVCLKTVGLLQYMLQCGMPIPVSPDSECGIFKDIFINIGDEQSIENELSTFSSHLFNMKAMMRDATNDSLLLIDEFGGGTEPMIGGALAQAMLRKLNANRVFAVITTHFQNLKQYAQETDGIVNGAMLYDRGAMKPLFQLRIGNPGSSFAIEIARKIGIPSEVIDEASDIVGKDYVSSDKYIQDIIRDKRYWENKRNEIHQREKKLEQLARTYEADVDRLREEKSSILKKAKDEAKELLASSNAMIERTIKEIKEAQAEREQTKQVRQNLEEFRQTVDTNTTDELEAYIQRKVERIKARQKRKAEKKSEKDVDNQKHISVGNTPTNSDKKVNFDPGDYVKLKGQQTIGKVLKVSGQKDALVAFGIVQMNVKVNQLEHSAAPIKENKIATFVSRETRDNIRETTLNFKSEIDIRGMRADEALQAIKYFIDDAQVASAHRVRILHGTGSGILRNIVRQYLSTVNTVLSTHDEHPQFGGAGITIVELE